MKRIDVLVRFDKNKTTSKEAFDYILVENSFGKLVPLKSVVDIVEEDSVYMLGHLDGKRVIYVTANVNQDIITSFEVNKILQEEFKNVTDGAYWLYCCIQW